MELYRGGLGANRNAGGLSLLPKLKYEHIYLTSFSKMRVDLAAQVMQTANVLMKCMDSYMYTICMYRY